MLDALTENREDALVVDSGNLFFRPGTAPVSTKEKSSAEHIARDFLADKRGVAAVGSGDLRAGTDYLHGLATDYALVLLSANLYRSATTQPVFPPFITRQAGPLTAALIGLTGTLPANRINRDLLLRSWQDTLPQTLSRLPENVDVVIVLSNLAPHENVNIAKKFRQIHIIVQSGGTPGNIPPFFVNNTLICQTADRGRYQGVLDMQWDASGKWSLHAQQEELGRKVERQLVLTKRKIAVEAGRQQLNPALEQRKLQLENALDTLEQQLVNRDSLAGWTYHNRFIALSGEIVGKNGLKALQRTAYPPVNEQ